MGIIGQILDLIRFQDLALVVLDEDDMASDSDQHVPTQQSVKAYVDANSGALPAPQEYDAANNVPDLDVSPSGINARDLYYVTVAGVFFTEQMEVGDQLVAKIDNPTTLDDWIRSERNLNQATETVLGSISLATQPEADAGTNDLKAMTPLKSSKFALYDGRDTEANILALSATTHLGEIWWSTDTKKAFKAITDLSAVDAWQGLSIEYDATSDAFSLPATQDGQTQDVGRETFFLGFNNDASGATALDPKVWLNIGGALVADPRFKNCVKPIADDLTDGSNYGVNTTAFSPGDKGKITRWGDLNNVNTSAWGTDDILFVDPTTPGDLTNVKPVNNAFVVGRVDKVHATEGIIFVDSSGINADVAGVGLAQKRSFFTGQTIVLGAGTFYEALQEDEGSIASVTETAVVPDDSIVGISQDHVTIAAPVATLLVAGLRDGQLDISIDTTSSQERVYIESYQCDSAGNVIDSGILSEPVGDLGVRPILVYSSSLLDLSMTTKTTITLDGVLAEDFTLPLGDRVRLHVLCEKVGAVGGDKTFTVYYGSDHDSFLISLAQIEIEDVNGLTEALDISLKAGGIWTESTSLKHYVYRENDWTGYPVVDTIDHLEPQDVDAPEGSVDTSLFPTTSNTSIVEMVQKITTTEPGYSTSLSVMAPFWDTDTIVRVSILNITAGTAQIIDNPILESGVFTPLGVGQALIPVGTDLEIRFQIYNSTAANAIDGGWTSNLGTGIPLSQEINLDNFNTPTVVEISHTDLDANNRATELDGVVSGSIVRITETGSVDRNVEFIVDTVDTASATSTKYTVLAGSVTNGPQDIRDSRTCTVHIDVPISQPTEYGVKTGYYPAGNPSWGTVTTELYYDGVLQPGSVDAYPINVVFQKAEFSADWFVMSVSGGGTGGGGSGTDASAIHVNQPAEISGIAEKTVLVGDDLVVIEDSEDAFAKKSAKRSNVATIQSDPTPVTGADQITNVMSLTQAEYDAASPDAATLYIITDA
jgi:hypothetical protein